LELGKTGGPSDRDQNKKLTAKMEENPKHQEKNFVLGHTVRQ